MLSFPCSAPLSNCASSSAEDRISLVSCWEPLERTVLISEIPEDVALNRLEIKTQVRGRGRRGRLADANKSILPSSSCLAEVQRIRLGGDIERKERGLHAFGDIIEQGGRQGTIFHSSFLISPWTRRVNQKREGKRSYPLRWCCPFLHA